MASGRVKEEWDHLERWYRHARGKQAHPSREGLDRESEDRAELYRCRPLERIKVYILVKPVEVNDGVTTEAEFDLAVQGLRARRVGVPLCMRAEDLKG